MVSFTAGFICAIFLGGSLIRMGHVIPHPANVFKEIDADEDKHLTPEEILAYLKKQKHEHNQPFQEDSEETQNMVKTIFYHEDEDKDGLISHDEFSGPKPNEL